MACEIASQTQVQEAEPSGDPGSGGKTPSRSRSASEEPSFVEWLERYSIGRAGAADRAPHPPPSILAIINERETASPSARTPTSPPLARSTSLESGADGTPMPPLLPSTVNKARRGPISLAITLSHGSSQASSAASNSSASTSSMTNPAVTEEMAASLLEHFRLHGTFPAPPGPHDEERLRLAHKYGLDQPIRRKAIDRICAIAKAHFKTKMVVVSLTLDDHQVLGAERGFDPVCEPTLDDPPRSLDVQPAFCTHAMAASHKDPSQVFIVADADTDWRFSRNPYATRNGGGVSFYAAANVNLPTGDDADKRGLPATLASGALCLMDNTRKRRDASEFSEEDRAVLSDLAEMIAREFQLGFEQRRREEESKQSEFLGAFLQQALVQPAQPGCLRTANSDPTSRATSSPSSPLDSPREEDGPTTAGPVLDGEPSHIPSNPRTPAVAADRSTYAPSKAPRNPPAARPESAATLAPSLFTTAAANLVSLTRSQSCGILDLRTFRSSHYQPQSNIFRSMSVSLSPTQTFQANPPFPSPPEFTTPALPRQDAEAPNGPRVSRSRTASYGVGPGPELRGKIGLMASEGAIDWRRIVAKSATAENGWTEREALNGESEPDVEGEDALTSAVDETLRMYATAKIDLFGLEGAFAAFSILPRTTSDTCCVPIFDVDGSPALMIVLSSTEKWFRFETSDRRFAQSVGAVLVGSLLRERARESDRAKLAFISQVSHEVRTPLYGVASQLSLIREFSTPVELRKVAPLLDVAEICVDSLSSVLEDTLDFSKLTNSSAQEEAFMQNKRVAPTNLVTLVEGVLKSTWIKKKRTDLVSVDLESVLGPRPSAAKTGEGEEKLELILEVEDKPDGWDVMTDVGGLRRVLLNVIGNALKFTKSGHVKTTVRYVGQASFASPDLMTPRPRRTSLGQPSTRGYVVIVVEDTGIGMSPEFLRDGGLFTPFKQADSFASGVGLGLSICDSIVKRLGPGRIDVSSELGIGTEISITLPMNFVAAQPSTDSFPFNFGSSNRTGTSSRRIISSELDDLFENPTRVRSAPDPSTTREPSSTSKSVAPADDSPTQMPPVDFPTTAAAFHSTLSPLTDADENDGPDEVAIEAAKVAIATNQLLESTVIPMSSPKTVGNREESGALVPALSVEATAVEVLAKKVEQQRKASIAPDVHVLFADDNPVARNILIKLFTGKGIKFSTAEDGQQAVDLFVEASGAISLILMDVQMPVMDGIGASHAIREIEAEKGWERCRIIALTGLSNESDIAEAADGGVDKWLVKGGKSLRTIMDEILDVQRGLEARLRP
ncbi:hypothetical protein JCM11491_007012 [Sporobolomyces phaffii]